MNKTNKGILLLTSAGFFNPKVVDKFIEIMGDPKIKRVAIITTASEGKETNVYSKLAKDQLDKMGFGSVDFIDLETQGANSVSDYDVVYVCGGNTFKLLKFARETNFKDVIWGILNRGGVYIGVSAGSLLVGPSVQIANEIAPDKNDVEIADFSGLKITDLTIFPHYDPKYEAEIESFETRNNVKVTRLTNNQAVIARGKEVSLVE